MLRQSSLRPKIGAARAVSGGIWGWFDDDIAFTRPWGFELGDIHVPVTVWQGGEDRMVPSSHGEWLAAHLPGAKAMLLPSEGHLSISVAKFGEIVDGLLASAPQPDQRAGGGEHLQGAIGPERGAGGQEAVARKGGELEAGVEAARLHLRLGLVGDVGVAEPEQLVVGDAPGRRVLPRHRLDGLGKVPCHHRQQPRREVPGDNRRLVDMPLQHALWIETDLEHGTGVLVGHVDNLELTATSRTDASYAEQSHSSLGRNADGA